MVNPLIQLSILIKEVRNGLERSRTWVRLAQMSIEAQYKQNTLGPFWISINTAILIGAFSFVYGSILQVELKEHMLYVASGLVCWYFYSSVLLKGGSSLVASRLLILQLPMPISVHLLKFVCQEVFVFFYNALILVIVCIFTVSQITVQMLLVIPAFLLILVNAFFFAFLIAILAARYRDVISTVQALITPLMFLTPIIWSSDQLADRPFFIEYNPIFHVIEIWRSPIVGSEFPTFSWLFVSFFTFLLILVCSILFEKYRNRIVYWL